jgi:hypothetical protein
MKNKYRILIDKREETTPLGELSVNGKIILKFFLDIMLERGFD